MKELEIIENSITPFWMKDLGYLQNGIKESICAICESFKPTGRQFMIVQGCDLKYDPSVLSISTRGGWVYYRGILYPVKNKALSCKDSNPTVYLNLVQNYDTSGKRNITIGDGLQFKDLYRDDYLEISLEKTQSSIGAITPGAWDLSERIVKQSRMVDTGIVSAETIENSSVSNLRVEYRQIGAVVQLYGGFNATSSSPASGLIAKGLPMPVQPIFLVKDGLNIQISATGDMIITSCTTPVNISEIVYLTDPVYNSNINDGHVTL